MNNTGLGVRSTAGYILAKAGMTGPDACILNRSIDGGCRVSSQGDAGHCPGQGWALPAPGNKGKQIADEVIE